MLIPGAYLAYRYYYVPFSKNTSATGMMNQRTSIPNRDEKIEQAVNQETNNSEIRYLRFISSGM